jgi:type 1 glutamine amidotransferase
MKALNDWIANGGGFIGFHSAADTSRPASADAPATPYTAIIGGAFKSHGKQFVGTVRVVDPKHPAIAAVPDGFTINDEWYVFTHLDTKNMHVLALLDPAGERANQEQYNIPSYPAVWCKAQGKGRIFYSAMGHREDVWENPTFLQMTADAIGWARGETELNAEPNYKKAVGHTE